MEQDSLAVCPSTSLLITGVPRSGTTLATAIVDGLEDTLALSEPQSHVDLLDACRSPAELVDRLALDLSRTRARVLQGGEVIDRRLPSGEPLTDYFVRTDQGAANVRRDVSVRRPGLSTAFLLATKHNALYTSVLPEVLRDGRFSILALVRNPIHSILSWQSLQIPVSRGRLPAGEVHWPELRSITCSALTVLEKQAAVIELFLRRYLEAGPAIRLVRYEDVAAGECSIATMLGRSTVRPVRIRKPSALQTKYAESIEAVLEVLQRMAPSVTKLYPELA